MTFSHYLCIVNSITRHIEYLILRHDCVIVPELGAFIAQYSPARIDEATGVIMPPSRSISFNGEVAHNDGLLAASIARASSTTFDRALASIADQVAALKSQIDNGGEFAVGRLGILRGNAEGNLDYRHSNSHNSTCRQSPKNRRNADSSHAPPKQRFARLHQSPCSLGLDSCCRPRSLSIVQSLPHSERALHSAQRHPRKSSSQIRVRCFPSHALTMPTR